MPVEFKTRRINLLHVDDEPAEHELVRESLKEFPWIVYWPVATLKDAKKLISEVFFGLALVDVNLDRDNDSNTDGQTVLSNLLELQPQCERIVYSKRFASAIVVDALFQPGEELAKSVLDKLDAQNTVQLLLRKREQFCQQYFRVDDIERLAERVKQGTRIPHPTQFIKDELQYLIDKAVLPDNVDVLPFQPIVGVTDFTENTKGRSGSYVGCAQFSMAFGVERRSGVLAVFKLGRRAEIIEEINRYRQFIGVFVSHTRRVEVLGMSTGAALGLIVYSYAGATSPTAMDQLSSLLDDPDPDFQLEDRIKMTIHSLFDKKELHAVGTGTMRLFDYMNSRFTLETREFKKTILLPLADKAVQKSGGDVQLSARGIISDEHGQQLALPTHVFDSSAVRGTCESCLCHGDLHAGNVFVGNNKEIVLIDYRHCGAAPRCWDFAVLDCSIRTETLPSDVCVKEALFANQFEERLWKAFWHPTSQASANVERLPYWARLSHTLMGCMKGIHSNVTEAEYAATLTIWIGRLLTLRLSTVQKLRLMSWLCFLCEITE